MNTNQKTTLAVVAGIAILLLGAYLSSKAPAASTEVTKNQLLQPGQSQQAPKTISPEDKKILDALKKIILLPDNIIPNIGIIKNIDNLKKSQPLIFASAKNGDNIIMYTDFAIIYDAKANKIMKLVPITPDQAQQAQRTL